MDIKEKLKQALIEELNLEDITPEEIGDYDLQLGEGLSLESLDAVALVVQKHFGVEIKDLEEGRSTLPV